MAPPKGNQYAKGNRGGGHRTTKYPNINLELVKQLAEEGLTRKAIAKILNVCPATITNYCLTNNVFLKTISEGEAEANKALEKRLYKLAYGWKNGKPHLESIKYWLNNRSKGKWKDRQEHLIGGNQYNNPEAVPVQTKQDVVITDNREILKKLPTELLEQVIKSLE
jgi:predicted transcriptional regulator